MADSKQVYRYCTTASFHIEVNQSTCFHWMPGLACFDDDVS